jgi:hypothetical protein
VRQKITEIFHTRNKHLTTPGSPASAEKVPLCV